jgi:hypothetical protein
MPTSSSVGTSPNKRLAMYWSTGRSTAGHRARGTPRVI